MQCDHACRGLVVAHTEWAERCNPINHRTPRRNAFQALLLHLHRGDVENEWLCVSDKAIGEDLIHKLHDLVNRWLAHTMDVAEKEIVAKCMTITSSAVNDSSCLPGKSALIHGRLLSMGGNCCHKIRAY